MTDADLPGLRRVRWYHAVLPFVAAASLSAIVVAGFMIWQVERGAVSQADLGRWITKDFLTNVLATTAFEAAMLSLSLWFLSRINDPRLPARFRTLTSDAARKGMAASLVAILAASVFIAVCDGVFHTHISDDAANSPLMPHTLSQLPLGLFCIVLLGPLAEEACFRGLIMGWLRRHWSFRTAMIASALVFALIHGKWLAPGGWDGWLITTDLFGMGLLLAFVAQSTGTLWASFLAHAGSNLAAVMMAFFLADRISL